MPGARICRSGTKLWSTSERHLIPRPLSKQRAAPEHHVPVRRPCRADFVNRFYAYRNTDLSRLPLQGRG